MCSNKLIEYYEAEIIKMYSPIHYRIWDDYNKLYNQEEAMYKRSDEYRKAKNRAYWNRPKSVIDKEALDEELAKLDYWVPRQNGPYNNSHITYSNNAFDNVSYETPLGFEPSISRIDYFRQEARKIKDLVKHPIWKFFADDVSNAEKDCMQAKNFITQNSNIQSNEIDPVFISDLIRIMEHFDFVPECKLFSPKRVKIVTNGCKVVVFELENKKKYDAHINIQKRPNQITILGCKENDTFTLPGIPYTYLIQEIWE